MAVAKRKSTLSDFETVLVLDDGQEVNALLRRRGFDVGDQEKIGEALMELPFIEKRIAKLKEQVENADGDDAYNQNLRRYKDFVKKQEEVFDFMALIIKNVVGRWDLCLTEEDEASGVTIPLTLEGIRSLEPNLRVDVFTKVTEKLKDRTESEKKDLSANCNGDLPTKTEPKALSQSSGQDTRLQCDTDSDPSQSSDGILVSSMKPS